MASMCASSAGSLRAGQVLTMLCSKYSRVKAISIGVGTFALFGGLEVLLILTLRVCPALGRALVLSAAVADARA
jgi:hypothetical protein